MHIYLSALVKLRLNLNAIEFGAKLQCKYDLTQDHRDPHLPIDDDHAAKNYSKKGVGQYDE